MSPVSPAFRLLLAGVCLLLASVHVRGQTPSSDVPQPPQLRFLFLDETPGAYSVKTNGGAYRQISSSPYAISQPFTPSGLAPLEIYKTGTIPDPVTGQKPRVKVATVPLPTNTTASLVVLAPPSSSADQTAALNYNVRFFDNDPRSFPPKSLRILNLGHSPMAAQFGEERALVEPGASRILRPVTDRYHRIVGKIAVSTPPDWKLLYNKVLIIAPEERLTGVFVYSASGLRHTYTALELAEMGPPAPGHFWLSYSDTP